MKTDIAVSRTQSSNPPLIGITCMRRCIELLGSDMEVFFLDRAYTRRIRAAGGVPVILPQLQEHEVESALGQLDALILSGGDDIDPEAYGTVDEGQSIDTDLDADCGEIRLLKAAVARQLPVLGICRGAQVINVSFGGSLFQEMLEDGTSHPLRPDTLDELLQQRHDLKIDADSELARIFGSTQRQVNSTHHQAIDQIAEGFRAVAWAPDGVVEAIESVNSSYVVAVQWHPEKLPPPQDQELFDDLVRAARTPGKLQRGRINYS